MLKINEIFLGIQGESTYAGRLCVMVRLTGCNLRCRYCDSQFAFYEGEERGIRDLLKEIGRYRCSLVCITGGEPLLQNDVLGFMNALLEGGYAVLLETSGSISLKEVPGNVIKIVDIKTPDSGFDKVNMYENLRYLSSRDEIKFVLCSREDYLWALQKLKEYDLQSRCTVLFSPAAGLLEPEILAAWIIEDEIDVRLQLQLHKMIWPGRERGA